VGRRNQSTGVTSHPDDKKQVPKGKQRDDAFDKWGEEKAARSSLDKSVTVSSLISGDFKPCGYGDGQVGNLWEFMGVYQSLWGEEWGLSPVHCSRRLVGNQLLLLVCSPRDNRPLYRGMTELTSYQILAYS